MKFRQIHFISIGIAAIFLMFAYGSDSSKSDSDSESSSCDYVSSLKDVKQCAAGVWIAKPTGDIWKRIVLKSNGTYDLFTATPESGKWGNVPDYSGTYEVAEARYSDTGKKYVYIRLNDSGLCAYQMVFDGTTALECNGNYDVLSKGDINPWN
ncbi:MAG: hypothetical protein H7339_17135 [Arcicella sp.]|nr:hypothetical protein [Arcicella sp.]